MIAPLIAGLSHAQTKGRTLTTKTDTRMLTIAEAAEHLHVHPRTVRRRIADGTLTGYRVGSHLIRLDPAEVDGLLRPIPTAGTAA